MLTLPYKAGVIMVAYSKDRFKYQNWIDVYPEKWQRRSRKKQWTNKGKAPNNQGRALLIQSGRLRRSIRIVSTTANSVTIGSDVPYAAAHNDGLRLGVYQRVRAFVRMNRKRDQYGITVGKQSKKSTRIKFVKNASGISHVSAHTRKMNMNLPRRRFMGESKYLANQISRMIAAEINKIFKS
jgi:phage gpG-like protein